MKIIWECSDIKPGQIVSKPNIERWIIGYLSYTDHNEKWVLISLSDGLVTKPTGKVKMAKDLNESKYLPIQLLDT